MEQNRLKEKIKIRIEYAIDTLDTKCILKLKEFLIEIK